MVPKQQHANRTSCEVDKHVKITTQREKNKRGEIINHDKPVVFTFHLIHYVTFWLFSK